MNIWQMRLSISALSNLCNCFNLLKIVEMRYRALTALLFLFLFSCSEEKDSRYQPMAISKADLPSVVKRGKLRVLAENSATSFFIYRGRKMGFEYEILNDFAASLGLELEIIVIDDMSKVHSLLKDNKADILACNYTVTGTRKTDIAFSIPYLQTNQVLVQRTKDSKSITPFISDPIQLGGKKIDVPENSSYFQRLKNLQEEIGDTIVIRSAMGGIGTEELIELVSDGQIDYTVTERNVAIVNLSFYDNLDIQTPVSFNQNIAFGLNKDAPLLLKRLNTWLKSYLQKERFTWLKRKYFNPASGRSTLPGDLGTIRKGQLSPFDDLLKREAAKHNFDWRLLAAIIQHESNFQANAQGFGGAYGLMQFMPGVGPKYGVFPGASAAQQVKGGMKMIASIEAQWKSVQDVKQRQKFILACYNAGASHILDARELARKKGLNPYRWDDNVEEMVKLLSRKQYYSDPVVKNGAFHGNFTRRYVREIMERYEQFCKMLPAR